jgi:hypothetical protein
MPDIIDILSAVGETDSACSHCNPLHIKQGTDQVLSLTYSMKLRPWLLANWLRSIGLEA